MNKRKTTKIQILPKTKFKRNILMMANIAVIPESCFDVSTKNVLKKKILLFKKQGNSFSNYKNQITVIKYIDA